MKYLFLAFAILLVVASAVTALMMPEQQSGRPIIYWVTDPNPARIEQIHLFEQWMVRNGHTDAQGRSAVELRLDTANNDPSKKIIQSVSGVAGDVMDLYSGGEIRYFQSMGVLLDLTEDAHQFGFDPSQTYPAVDHEITVEGRQYSFPCNVSTHAYWVNNEVFRQAGMEPPAWEWSLDDFERIGKELVAKANVGRPRREVFLTSQIEYLTVLRSMGLDRFNETMTRCALDDPRYVELLQRIHRWTFVDHILPQSEDLEAMASQQAGYGGNAFQLFNRGNLAMLYSGRYALIQFRAFNDARRRRGEAPLDMSVVECPNGGFPNTSIAARSAAIYRGSPHQEYAKLFLAFLAGEEYNMQIVDDADSLPPGPRFARTEAFARPPKYPEEQGLHEPWAKLAETIAIPASYSPFVLDRVATRIQLDLIGAFMAGRGTAQEAAQRTVRDIQEEIELRLAENPALRELYEQRLADQKRIDELRARGETVPIELIANPFHRRYYVQKGWAK